MRRFTSGIPNVPKAATWIFNMGPFSAVAMAEKEAQEYRIEAVTKHGWSRAGEIDGRELWSRERDGNRTIVDLQTALAISRQEAAAKVDPTEWQWYEGQN